MSLTATLQRIPGGRAILLTAGLAVLGAAGWLTVEWTINRIYVEPGESVLLRYKGPPLPFLPGSRPAAPSGRFAQVDPDDPSAWPKELGVLEHMLGPGRHFYCPLWWEMTRVPDIVVQPGEVAIASSRMGRDLPAGQFLVEGDLGSTEFKGILRKAFGPGRYRVNSYAYDFKLVESTASNSDAQTKHSGWVSIPTGYVGVVTNLAGNPALGTLPGIQEDVLPPGLYPVNPREKQIDMINIGFRENSITAELKKDAQGETILDESGEPAVATADTGIAFPSNDGFQIQMDFTAVWGIMPEQAADVVRKFGNVQAVEDKVVTAQIESICRNEGSRLGAVELLVGESRQSFQEATSRAFKQVLEEKDITLLYGLVRHIYIPQAVRQPIQQKFVADELKLTREQEQLTTRTEANLEEARQTVELEGERVKVQTERMVAAALAEGRKKAEETRAETSKLVAAVDRQTAELLAKAEVVLGEADASSTRLVEESRAGRFRLAVEAFGSGEAFNQWVFASGLPDDIQLDMLYAGEGTFWTDLKGFSETMLGRQAGESQQSRSSSRQSDKLRKGLPGPTAPVRPTSTRLRTPPRNR